MKYIATIAFLFFLGCSTLNIPAAEKYENGIKCIEVSRLFPVIGMTGNLRGYDTLSIKIFHKYRLVMYRFSYDYIHMIDDSVDKKEKRFDYIISRKGDSSGIHYDLNDSILKERVPVDSFINSRWVRKFDLYQLLHDSTSALVSSVRKDHGNILEECYFLKGVKDTTRSGQVCLFYTTKLNGIEYSLSKELDSLKQMKLYKATIVNNSRFLKQYNITMDRIETYYQIQVDTTFDQEKILGLFERFKADRDGLNF